MVHAVLAWPFRPMGGPWPRAVKTQQATHLLGFVLHEYDMLKVVFDDDDQTVVDKMKVDLKNKLGVERYEQILEAGQTLTLEESVEIVMDQQMPLGDK